MYNEKHAISIVKVIPEYRTDSTLTFKIRNYENKCRNICFLNLRLTLVKFHL